MVKINGQLIGRIPPHSIDAEQSVLGAMIVDKEAINVAVESIKPDDFYKQANAEIYEAIIILFNKNEPSHWFNYTFRRIEKKRNPENTGGVTYLANLSSSVATTANVEYYCMIRKIYFKKAICSSDEIMSKAYEDSEEVNSIIETAEKNIFDITQGSQREGFSPISQVLLDSFAKIEEMAANKGALTGLTTGLTDIDHKLSGLQKVT